MKLRTILLAAAIILAASATVGCKKEKEDPVKPYLDGKMAFTIDKYIAPGTKVVLEASGAKHQEDKEIGYSWYVTPGMEKADTVKTEEQTDRTSRFEYTFGEELRTYSVSVSAFATGYYPISKSELTTTVKGGLNGSISEHGIKDTDLSFTDTRDDKVYYYTTINGVDWMRQNLAFEGAGIPFDNYKVMTDVYGMYYNWEEANTVCPSGWQLPSEEDIKNLATALGGKTDNNGSKDYRGITGKMMVDAKFNGQKLWEFWPENKITGESKLAFLPAGYADRESGRVYEQGSFSVFWTSSESKDGQGMYRYIVNKEIGNPDLLSGKGDKKTFAANVRCIRVEEE